MQKYRELYSLLDRGFVEMLRFSVFPFSLQVRLIFKLSFLSLLFFLLLFGLKSQGQTTSEIIFNTSGTWTVPEGVTQITVEAWGGGAGGDANKGNGGGGGAYAKSIINNIAPGSYQVVIGSGGIGGSTGGNGGNSIFGGSLVIAAGAQGNTGGSSSACVGDVLWNGGNGGPTGGNSGGGGGGSAFNNANGNPGGSGGGNSGGTGGTGTGNGGDGGVGNNSLGTRGSSPGGGGGGGGNKTNTGADGAPGRIIISWCTSPNITAQPTNQTVTYGSNASFSVSTNAINVSTYQWQVNSGSGWSNTGTNSATLTVTNPSVLMSGFQYRCIVTVNCGSYTVSNSATLTVNKKGLTVTAGNQAVTYGTPANQITQNGTYTVSGFVNSENTSVISGSIFYASNYTNQTNAETPGITITPNVQNLTAANYSFTPVAGTITITKASQFINFGSLLTTKPLKDFVNEPVPLDVASSAGLPVSITLGSGSAATLNYDVAQSPPWFLTDVGETGFVTIILNQSGNINYNAATEVVRIFDVTKTNQEIIFPNVASVSFSNGLTLVMPASATSALDVSYQVVSGPATVSGNSLNITGAGSILVKAIQDGDPRYNAAAEVTKEIVVTKGTQTISINVPAESITSSTQITASSTSGLPVALTLGDGSAAVSLVNQGTYYTLTGVGGSGNIFIVGNQAGNNNFLSASQVIQTIDLSKANQIISFNTISNQTYSPGQTLTLSATAGSGLGVSFSVVSGPATLSGNTLSITGAGSVTVKASQAGNASYNPAPEITRQFEVSKATPLITLANIVKTFGDFPFSISPSSTSTAAFSYNSSNTLIFTLSGNTISIAGSGNANLLISQEQTANYFGATKTVAVTINNTASTIVVTGGQTFTYSGLPQGPQTSTVSGSQSTVSYSYIGTGGTSFGPGPLRPTNVGTYSVTASVAGDENYGGATSAPYAFTINKAAPTINVTAYSETYSGFSNVAIGTATGVSGESLSGLDLSATLHTDAGSYDDTWIFTDITGNYTNSSGIVSNIINKKDLSVTALDQEKCFGESFVFSGTEFTSTGLVGTETIGTVTLLSSGSATDAISGNYSILPSGAAGGTFKSDNYNISYTNGLLAVKPLPTLGGALQPAVVCEGTVATINLTGLLPEKIFTLDYTINGVAQTTKTGLYADDSGKSSFTTPVLLAANGGQTLQITGITITSETPNCYQSFATNVTLEVNPLPTLTNAIQQSTVCEGNAATISINGLLPGTTFTLYYSINGVDQLPVTNLTSNGSGNSEFITPLLTAANNGQILQINGIEVTGVSPTCIHSFATNVTLSVNPNPVAGTAGSNQTICIGSSPSDILLTGSSGSVQWQSSSDNIIFTDIAGAVSGTLGSSQMGTISQTTYYRAKVTSGVCTLVFSNVVTVIVQPTLTVTISSNNGPVCAGDNAVFTLTGTSGTTVTYKINSETNSTIILTDGSAIITITEVTTDQTLTLISVEDTNCSQSLSGTSVITVNPLPVIGSFN